MKYEKQIVIETSRALLDSRIRMIQLAGEDLVARGRNPLIVNELVFQESMKAIEKNTLERMRRLDQIDR